MAPTASRKHVCDHSGCDYSFAKRTHLERHQRTHTRVRDFTCPHCSRTFSRLDSRDRHISTVHSHQSDPGNSSHSLREVGSQRPARITSASAIAERAATLDRRAGPDNTDSPIQQHRSYIPPFLGAEQLSGSTLQAADLLASLRSPAISSYAPGDVTLYAPNAVAQTSSDSDWTSSSSSMTLPPPLASVPNQYSETASSSNADQFAALSSMEVEPMISSLFWKSIEASIFEATGSAYPSQYGDNLQKRDASHSLTSLSANNASASTLLSDRNGSSSTSLSAANRSSDEHQLSSREQTSNRHQVVPAPVNTLNRTGSEKHPEALPTTLVPGATHLPKKMVADLKLLIGHIETPIEPEKGITASCFWLYLRHFVPSSMEYLAQRQGRNIPEDPSLTMTRIAIGSLWRTDEAGRKWGRDVWLFTARIACSQGMPSVGDTASVRHLMTILLLGHSYVLMSSDLDVHKLGQRAWLYSQILCDQGYPIRPSFSFSNVSPAGQSRSCNSVMVKDDELKLERMLSTIECRDRLGRGNDQQLQSIWQQWLDLETRIRVAWGVYIFDSQHSTWIDKTPALQSHFRQHQPEPAPDVLSDAKTASIWLSLYADNIPQRRSLDTLLPCFYQPFSTRFDLNSLSLSQLAYYIILESIHSTWIMSKESSVSCEVYWSREVNDQPIDPEVVSPDLLRGIHALANWRLSWTAACRQSRQPDRYCLLLRWNSIHLSFCTQNVDLVTHIRTQARHRQSSRQGERKVLQVPSKYLSSPTPPNVFFHSARGRRSLWHSGQICTIISILPRGTSVPVHVAQTAYEAVFLLVVFVVTLQQVEGLRQQSSSQLRFELLDPADDDYVGDNWKNVGLAGFSSSDVSDSSLQDWGGRMKLPARDWINDGKSFNATLAGLPVQDCTLALKDLLRTLDESNLRWCLAEDYKRLAQIALSLL